MNPFSNNSYIIDNQKFYEHKIKSLTLSGKYLAVVQKIPPEDYRLDTIRCILGSTSVEEYKEFAMSIFKVFKVPLMKIKVIVTLDTYLLSAIEPLDYDTLTINEKKNLEGMGEWQK
jgi:RimK-like ATPgrasp N-terminal domain